jgi:hypothetical protein
MFVRNEKIEKENINLPFQQLQIYTSRAILGGRGERGGGVKKCKQLISYSAPKGYISTL